MKLVTIFIISLYISHIKHIIRTNNTSKIKLQIYIFFSNGANFFIQWYYFLIKKHI